MYLNPTWLQTSSWLSVFPGFQSRLCWCWRAGGWGRSSSSLCSWTRRTGRARAADRASTSWSMSLRGEPASSSPTSTLTGSKSSRWMCDESRGGQKNTSLRHAEEIVSIPLTSFYETLELWPQKTSAKVGKCCNLYQFFNASLYH